MKIIKFGDPECDKQTRRFTCGFCGCIFDADANEYELISGNQREPSCLSINCPYCHRIVTLLKLY